MVKHIVEQNNILRKLKKWGSKILYKRPVLNEEIELSIVVFSDASRIDENGQIGIVSGLLLVELTEGTKFHALSWLSHKAKRPVKSIPSAKILAASEAIDEGKMLKKAYSELLNVNVKLIVCVDSKDLFTSMTTQRLSLDRSI